MLEDVTERDGTTSDTPGIVFAAAIHQTLMFCIK
jgi:hypothetical protein